MTPTQASFPIVPARGFTLRAMAGSWLAKSAVIVAVIGLQYFGPKALVVTYFGLATWALLGPRQAIQALSLSWVPSLLNPDLFNFGFRMVWYGAQSYVLLKWTVLLAAGAVCLWHVVLGRRPLPVAMVWVTFFCVVAGIASAVTSFLPDVSLAKLASFWLGTSVVLICFKLTAHEGPQNEAWFLGLARTLVLLNLPLLFLPSMYLARHDLFRGLFFQPQNTGVVFAVIAAWLGGRCLSSTRLPLIDAIGAAGALVVLWQTGSRTAAFALLGSMAIALAMYLFARRPSGNAIAAYVLRTRFGVAAVLMVIVFTVSGGVILEGLSAFVQKRPEGTIKGANWELLASREQLIREQWWNFQQNPVFGNGFGVPSLSNRSWVLRDDTTGIPVSAVTEKGFLGTAVLEETGIVGAAILLMLLGSLARKLYRLRSFALTWAAITAFTINFGESAFFSFGGIGLFLWLMIGLAAAGTVPARKEDVPVDWLSLQRAPSLGMHR